MPETLIWYVIKTTGLSQFQGYTFFRRHRSEINRGVFICGNQKRFDLNLHMSSMVIVAQVMRSELVL
jgi:hypothetical protein